MTEPVQTIYDEAPYPPVSHALTHPDRLATVATLLGMDPAPLESCRVLELGCACGGNLIPMAYTMPGSHFVGLDLSRRQIAQGQEILAALGLTNVTLSAMNILDVTADLGQFDYIIAHGIYSWVPPEVQDRLLAVCRENLAPQGVAYVSYNIYPGWNMLGTLRQMMLFHTRHVAEPFARVAEARALLDFLTTSISTDENSHGSFLYVYLNYIKEYFMPKNDTYLLHDELSEVNEPVYFYQFAEHAARHGLQYLGDVQFATMLAANFPPEVAQGLRQMAKSTVEVEQYMDFLRNRMFRQSLLCHQEVTLNARLQPERLSKFYFASSALPAENAASDLAPGAVEKFNATNGATLTTDHPVTKAAMLHLTQAWPQEFTFAELLAAAQAQLPPAAVSNPTADAQLLGANLLKAYTSSEQLVELHVFNPPITTGVSEYPVASPVARYQARHDYDITTLRHERVSLDKIGRALLPYLDGSRDHAALVDVLQEENLVEIERQDGRPIEDAAELRAPLAELIHSKLNQFASAALLVGKEGVG